jgi:ankyrin repeat protein
MDTRRLWKCYLGIDLNSVDIEYDRTPLLWATIGGHKKIVKMLLAIDGIDLNSADTGHGWTLLLWAATNGCGNAT